VNGATVTFVTDLGGVLSPRTTANGIATSPISSTAAGTAHITATSGIAQDTAIVTFTPGTVSEITLQADPTLLVADGASTSVITATLVDQYGNPVANGIEVSFNASLGTVTTPHLTTQGKAAATFTAGTLSGTAIVSATADGHSGSISLALLPRTVDLSSSVKLASASVITTVGQLTYTVMLTNSGNAVAANVTVTDPIPLGTIFTPGSSTGGATYNSGLNQIEWSGSVPAGGLVRFSYVITVTNIEYALITNRAFVNLNGIPDRILSAETWVIPPSPEFRYRHFLPIIVRMNP
jgi:adhesin/invasin